MADFMHPPSFWNACVTVCALGVFCDYHSTLQSVFPHTSGDGLDVAPVPVPQSFAEELIRRCAAEPSTVRCIDCDTDISASNKWEQHQLAYGQLHTSASHSTTATVTALCMITLWGSWMGSVKHVAQELHHSLLAGWRSCWVRFDLLGSYWPWGL